ncbi:mitochondrial inner membrane protease subunit 2 isoform X2 [Takifugu rubripes]|uniref:mitochondrial inner membrane protease subunit 2 isoform X2 n=2 Tax=Takifugu TaxID=31032 RepID=UPI0011459BA0|nr:mitochondrial inner membrane protease subunit 2 isoform X2 [Takifugu rubripes]XP_056907004.1 mitochondrial inner membrane protease subunit 2 isoform X1 [Takifugu flavidus]
MTSNNNRKTPLTLLVMAQQVRTGRRYLRAFVSGFFVAVPVSLTVFDRFACVARVEGASMQPSLNPEAGPGDVVLLNRWSVRNHQVQRGDIVSVLSPKNPQQKIIKRVIGLEGDFIRTLSYKNRYVRIPDGHFWIEGDHHGHSLDSNSFGPPLSLFSRCPWGSSMVERLTSFGRPNVGSESKRLCRPTEDLWTSRKRRDEDFLHLLQSPM